MSAEEIEKLIEEAKELEAKVTAGPWLYKHMSVDGATISKGLCRGDGDWFTPTADDWAFIAAARSIVPELVSAIATLSAELAKAREACEQGKARCQNFLNGLLPACGPMTSATAVMISSIQNDFKEALGHDFEAEVKALAAKGPNRELSADSITSV